MLKLIILLSIFAIILPVHQVFGQIVVGIPAEHVSITATIEENGDVHVSHVVKKNDEIVQVSLLPGKVENLQVKDVNNKTIQHATSGNELITLFPPKVNFIIEYDLSEVLFLKEGVWTWDFLYTKHSVGFIFPDTVDLVFANNRPVRINNVDGLNCHGCQIILEYIIDEPVILKEVEWEKQKFTVLIRTLDKIGSFSFDQPSRTLSFETTDEKKFITLIIPLELLWNPYEVYLGEQKILKHEFFQNSTHVWLNIKPETAGTIEIIGISAIPEFSILLPLVFGIAVVVGLSAKNRFSLR